MSPVRPLLRLAAAAGLAVDTYVHWHLASNFDTLKSSVRPHLSQGQLFRIEAVLALIAAVLVLVVRHRLAAAFAFLVAAGGVAAVLVYAYVDFGELGPLPAMYDPACNPEKPPGLLGGALPGSLRCFL